MKKTQNKIKKMAAIKNSKKAIFDEQLIILEEIKAHKIKAIEELRRNQKKYLESADMINSQRNLGNQSMALVLEPSLEYIKGLWHDSLKRVQKLDYEQRAQFQNVLTKQQELRSLEKLEEKYQNQYSKYQNIEEQKSLDEVAISMNKTQIWD